MSQPFHFSTTNITPAKKASSSVIIFIQKNPQLHKQNKVHLNVYKKKSTQKIRYSTVIHPTFLHTFPSQFLYTCQKNIVTIINRPENAKIDDGPHHHHRHHHYHQIIKYVHQDLKQWRKTVSISKTISSLTYVLNRLQSFFSLEHHDF